MTLDTKALRALGSVTIWDPQLRERIKRRGVHDCFDDVDLAFVDALDEIVQLRLALGEALDIRERAGLSRTDMDTLRRAAELRDTFGAGIFARDVGQRAHFRRLERLGLIESDGSGVDIDDHSRDVWLYKLTAKGEAEIAARRKP